MPPKPKTTKDMIITAAFETARESGAENINARTVSERLGCSTQPVMYHFKTIEDLKRAAYQKADEYHAAYIMDTRSPDPMLDIGLNYIRFAAEERNLFRFLFQSNSFSGKSLSQLIDAEELEPILDVLAQSAKTTRSRARDIFLSLFLFAHGYASMLAGNAMEYSEEEAARILKQVYLGALEAMTKREEQK